MKYRIFYLLLGLIFLTITVLVFANEKTGWGAPEKAKKMKNPIKPTIVSIQKRKEFMKRSVPFAMASKEMEKVWRPRA